MSRRPFRRPKSCPFSGENAPTIDIRTLLLQRFTRNAARSCRAVLPRYRQNSASLRRLSSVPAILP